MSSNLDSINTSPIPISLYNKSYGKDYQQRNISCLNCNKKGHIYKNCRAPANSYGIIVFKKFWGSRMKYLMIQRKYSHSFVDILLGRFYNQSQKGKPIDFYKLARMVKYLPASERIIICKCSFKTLWNKMWTWNIAELNQKYHEYLARYNNSIDYIISLFDELVPVLQQPEWEFPKGKRALGESDYNCAIRECFEETTLKRENYYIYPNLRHFQDKFQGTDGNEYCNNYYLAELMEYDQDSQHLTYYNCTNFDQSSEIKKIGWFTIDEIEEKLICSFPSRLSMIKHVNNLVSCWQINNKYGKTYVEPLI